MAAPSPSDPARPPHDPIWVSEPFRVFFPIGVAAGIFGVLLWPLFYAGWWPIYPALQHPRLLIFGFGAAFVFGFLGTAWPRFLEVDALRLWELSALVSSWAGAQIACVLGEIRASDLLTAWSMLLMLFILGKRLFGRRGGDSPPPGFALAFVSVALAAGVVLVWFAFPMQLLSPRWHLFLRLLAWQGFLLLPLLGVGSYLFVRFFPNSGPTPAPSPPKFRALAVWSTALLILVSFAIEAQGWVRLGNGLRLVALIGWALGAAPSVWKGRAPTTRAWALRVGLGSIALAYVCRILWPTQLFAFEHILFLGGFGLVMLLTADRVVLGHCGDLAAAPPLSRAWRWIVWLMIVAAATRATADLVPSTRISHHIYAALTLIAIFVVWLVMHRSRWGRVDPA